MEKNNRKTVLKTAMRLCLLFATLLLILAGCDLPDPFYIKVISIEGVPETGEAGTPLFLTGTIRPAFASNDNIIWSVTDAGNTGAAISGNILYTQASGTVTIRAIIANGTAEGKEYTQDFEIVFNEGGGAGGEPVSVTGVTLNHTTLSMNVGGTATLTATVNPTNAANKNVTWSSSAPSIATVSTSGLVTAVAVGTATITVTTADGGKTAECSVGVNYPSLLTLSGTITISPNNGVTTGTELIAVYSGSETVTYHWEKDGTNISGATSNKYTPTEAGNYTVTVSLTGYNNKTSAPVVVSAAGSVSPIQVNMVTIPAGTFIMGSPTTEPNRFDNETQHSVTLSGFSMSKYQVTQAQWTAVMGKTIVELQALATSSTTDYGRGDNYPVYYVSWYDAIVFCNKLSLLEGLEPVYSISGKTNPSDWGNIPTSSNSTWDAVVMNKKNGYRLPTEAEWEYACRAGTTKAYNTGDTISNNTGWYSNNSGSKTHEVGLKSANAWGLHDMHGNVYELCWDWYNSSYYSSSPANDPTGAVTGSYRVSRGGYWNSNGQSLRSAERNSNNPTYRNYSIGIRLVRSSE